MTKIGIRKPNPKASIKARTTGRATRAMKSATNPVYGKKGMGIVNDPKRAINNAVYSRTTVGVGHSGQTGKKPTSSQHSRSANAKDYASVAKVSTEDNKSSFRKIGLFGFVLAVVGVALLVGGGVLGFVFGLLMLIVGFIIALVGFIA